MGNLSYEKQLAEQEINIIEYLCLAAEEEYNSAREAGSEFLLYYEMELSLWRSARDAHKNGKKLVLYAGSIPLELLRSSSCVPINIDFAEIRLAGAAEHARKLIYAAEKILPDCFCSMAKTMLGTAELRRLGLEPDAFIYAPNECDASKYAYTFVQKSLDLPCFEIDVPKQKNPESLGYVADQLERMQDFLAELTGTKADEEEFSECISRTNRSYELMEKCAELRRETPCPLPGNLLVKNGYGSVMACLPETVAFLEEELELGLKAVSAGKSSCKHGEKHRAAFIQNMLWSSGEVTDWLEDKYGCACVIDAFGLVANRYFERPDDKRDCLIAMADRMRGRASLHGVSWSGAQILEHVDRIFSEYQTDVSIFAGHVGCRQTWSAVRMVSEFIHEKYGIPTLELALDGIDMKYKPIADIKRELSEYMDTVVCK